MLERADEVARMSDAEGLFVLLEIGNVTLDGVGRIFDQQP